MCRSSSVVSFVLLLVVVQTTENLGNSTREDELDNIMQYESHVNFTTGNQDEASTRDHEDSVHHNNYMKNLHKKDNQDTPAEFLDNSMKTDDRDSFTTSYESHLENNFNGHNLSKMCNSTVCIPICCELGYRIIKDVCTPDTGDFLFPEVYEINKTINDIFQLVVSDPCQTTGRYALTPDINSNDKYVILTNGSIYLPNLNDILDPTSYCFAIGRTNNKYEPALCFKEDIMTEEGEFTEIMMSVGFIISLPFLLITFIVYTILKELWNLHGYILRGYVGSLFVTYLILTIQLIQQGRVTPKCVCVALAVITQFSYSASFFWLNVMCFNIWRTFRKLRPLPKSMTSEERKKFIIYSIYVWGCASTLTVVSVIMDYVPSVPKNFIKPEFAKKYCWFATEEAQMLYLYGPISVTFICNICMFISTALKYARHRRNIARHLGKDSGHHDNNKQPFILYLKLFILMGISPSAVYVNIILLVIKNGPLLFLRDLSNTLQGFIIFIIFVWKDRIKGLLLKRCRNSSHSTCTTMCTCIPTRGMTPWEMISPCRKIYTIWTNWRARNWSAKSEFPEVFYYINVTQGEGFYRTDLQSIVND